MLGEGRATKHNKLHEILLMPDDGCRPQNARTAGYDAATQQLRKVSLAHDRRLRDLGRDHRPRDLSGSSEEESSASSSSVCDSICTARPRTSSSSRIMAISIPLAVLEVSAAYSVLINPHAVSQRTDLRNSPATSTQCENMQMQHRKPV